MKFDTNKIQNKIQIVKEEIWEQAFTATTGKKYLEGAIERLQEAIDEVEKYERSTGQ